MLLSTTQSAFRNNNNAQHNQLSSLTSPSKDASSPGQQEVKGSPVETTGVKVDPTSEGRQEPTVLLCFHCGQMCASAWELVQHFSQFHSQIYAPGADISISANKDTPAVHSESKTENVKTETDFEHWKMEVDEPSLPKELKDNRKMSSLKISKVCILRFLSKLTKMSFHTSLTLLTRLINCGWAPVIANLTVI